MNNNLFDSTPFEEKVEMQRIAYAIKACHMLGYDAEKASKTLSYDKVEIELFYKMIEREMIRFGEPLES